MDLRNYEITVGEILKNSQAKAMLQKELPILMRHPMLPAVRTVPLKKIIKHSGKYVSLKKMQSILDKLSKI